MSKFWKEMILPTVLLILATLYYAQVTQLGNPKNYIMIRPVYFGLVLLYVINAVMDYLDCRKELAAGTGAAKEAAEKQHTEFLDQPLVRIVLLFAAMALFALLLSTLGFLISGFLLIAAIMGIMRVKGWWQYLVFPLLAVAALYLIFKVALGIPLPAGILGL